MTAGCLPPDQEARLEMARQLSWESEGARSAKAGNDEHSNPYEQGTQAWHHWHYGHQNEKGQA